MSTVEKWGWASVVATLGAALCLGALLFVTAVGLDSGQNQAIAAWVQAIGSIGAVIGAFLIGSTQMKEARRQQEAAHEREKKVAAEEKASATKSMVDGAKAIARASFSEVKNLAQIFRGYAIDPEELGKIYRPQVVQALAQSLGNIPVFELGNEEFVVALVNFRSAFLSIDQLLASTARLPSAYQQVAPLIPGSDVRAYMTEAQRNYAKLLRASGEAEHRVEEQIALQWGALAP